MTPIHAQNRPARRALPASLLALLAGSAGFAQQAQPAAPAPAPSAEAKEEVIVMSPFEVSTDRDQGYFAENTLAGSRMNANLADLAASISVITKQQMSDTGSVDINDIFRYEVNTEGSLTYTPTVLSLRSDGVVDQNAGVSVAGGAIQNNATANRVRGLGVPSAALNYYPANPQVPVDSYNLDSVEISRGPNSMLFGMGSPAGIVNQNTARADLQKNKATLQFRTDQNGSFRGVLNFNRVLLDNKLAIYGATVRDERQFERRPSYDKTTRMYGAITYKPFRKTTIRVNAESFDNDNRRPNTLTPRDFVTEWRTAGEPMYDPVTKRVTFQATGKVTGPYIVSASSPYANQVRDYIRSLPNYNAALWNSAQTTYNGVAIFGEGALNNAGTIVNGVTPNALYAPGITWTNQARTIMRVADGMLVDWFQPLGSQKYLTSWGTATNPAANPTTYPTDAAIWANSTWADMYNRYFTASNGWSAQFQKPLVGGYKYPGVTDKAIYDWSKVNINQMNFGHDSNKNYNIELEQEILPELFFNAGWFRQDYKSTSNYTVAQLNVATLFVDTNTRLPNGQPNPYAGKVYVEDQDPDQAYSTETNEHQRAMLAYTPDFTRRNGWMKWLGRHQILGVWSRQDTMRLYERRRLHYTAAGSDAAKYRYLRNSNNNADGTPTGWNRQTTSLRHMYYLADPADAAGTVTQSSGEWNYSTYAGNIQVYDYAASQFNHVGLTTEYIPHDATTGRNQRKLKSLSAGMTNYLWNDRLITTFGVRQDKYRARATTNGIIYRQELSQGLATDVDLTGKPVAVGKPVPMTAAMTNQEKWVNGVYQTDTVYNRWNRWDIIQGTTRTAGGVFKPFKGWSNIENRASNGSLWAQFLRDFGVSYNKSDNFNAPSEAQVDAFGSPLPKPTGEGEDYGFQFSLLDNKLFARVTWFNATNLNERTNPGSSISRLTGNVDTTIFRNWARTIARINLGDDPRLATWNDPISTTKEEQIKAGAEKIWQLPYEYYTNVGTIWATRDAEAKGVEATVNYNPNKNWTMKLTAAKQTTVYRNVLRQFSAWYDVRYPVWSAAKATDYLLPQYQNLATYTTSAGRAVDLRNFLSSYGFVTEVRDDEPNGNTTVQRYYDNVVQPQASLARDLDGQAAPNQRRYRASFLTTYTIREGRFRNLFFGGSERWEDKAVIGYLGRSSGASTTPGFMDLSDTTKPVYDKARFYTDLWVGYSRELFSKKVNLKVQLNVANVFENGRLQVTAVNYDGSPYSFRIVDPRQYSLTATFDF